MSALRRATPSKPPVAGPRTGVKRPREASADGRAPAAATPSKAVASTPPVSTPAADESVVAMHAKYMAMPCRSYAGVCDKRGDTLSTQQQAVKQKEMELMKLQFQHTENLGADLTKRDAKRLAELQEVEDLKAEKRHMLVSLTADLHAQHEAINRTGIKKQEERQFILATGEVKVEQLVQTAADYERKAVEETEKRVRKLQECEDVRAALQAAKEKHTEVSLKTQLIKEETDKLCAERDEYSRIAGDWDSKREEAANDIQKTKKALNLHEEERRKLHNKIEELKGNIRVYCRIRAPLSSDREQMEFDITDSGKTLNVRGKERTVLSGDNTKADDYTFKYDHIFGPGATQENVFAEVSPLVQSCLDGFKVCIFAYGQTGSGKTYTMEGPNDNKGVIPQAVNMIFQKVTKLTQERGFQCSLSCSFLEIYNDHIRDLLGVQKTGLRESGSKATEKNLKITGNDNDVVVEGLSEYPVDNQATVGELLTTAQSNRQTASTKMNDRSSRSHSVFMLKIKTHNPVTGVSLSGLLNLIDLAGSEKVNASEVQGQRFKEAVAINTSLTHLGDVVHALGTGGHVPYRNCTLTRLLQPSLGGSSKCLMLVNTSPFKEHIEESIKSLKFAKRVNSTKVGVAKRTME